MLPSQRYTVSDLDPLHLDYLESRFGDYSSMDVRKVNLENSTDFNPLEEQFDTVICVNVLEHIRQDEQALKNLYRALIPGGSAILLVPQGPWLYGSLDRVLDHRRRYTRQQLLDKCKRTGFTIERAFSFNRVGSLSWFINGKILRRKRFSKLQLKFYDSFVWLWRILDKIVPLPGLSIIAIARKPGHS